MMYFIFNSIRTEAKDTCLRDQGVGSPTHRAKNKRKYALPHDEGMAVIPSKK